MKRVKAILILVTIVLSSISVSAKCIEVTVSNYGGLKAVLGDKGNDADSLVIHGQINRADIYTACELSDSAKLVYLNLKDCNIENNTIADNAFHPQSVSALFREIILPDNVKKIGEYAFAYMQQLEKINLPKSLTTIGFSAFKYNTKLQELEIPEGVEVIPDHCFLHCTNLKKVVLPSTLKTIQTCCFDGSGLEEINLPEGLDSIADSAFDFTNLKSVEIPSTLKKMGNFIFSSCLYLKSIKISEGVTSIPQDFASTCIELEHVEIPSTITSIATRAFDNCRSLKTIKLNEGLKSIGDEGLRGCGFETLVLPSTLEYLGIDALGYCTNLKELYSKAIIPPKGDENQRAFKGTDNSIPVYIPIGSYESYVYSPYWKYFCLFVELEADKYPSSGNEIVLNDGNNIKVYSSMSKLIISTNDEQNGMLKYQIYQIDGRTVGSGSITDNYTEVSLPNGIYLVTVGSEKFKIKI
jgi:hypothetical protein